MLTGPSKLVHGTLDHRTASHQKHYNGKYNYTRALNLLLFYVEEHYWGVTMDPSSPAAEHVAAANQTTEMGYP